MYYHKKVLQAFIGLLPTLAISMCSSFLAGFTAVVPCQSSLLSFPVLFSSTIHLKFPLMTCWQPHPRRSAQLSPLISQHSAGCRVENKPWLCLKLLSENTTLRFLGIIFPESHCLKSCFGTCLASSAVYSINNPWTGLINVRVLLAESLQIHRWTANLKYNLNELV